MPGLSDIDPKNVKFSILVAQPPKDARLDPKDPGTWWGATAPRVRDRIEIQAQMHDHCMMLAGVPAKKFYYDPEVNFKVASAVAAYYGLDSPQAIGDAYNFEAEALGQKMIYGENSMPTIDFREPFIQTSKDLDRLKPVDRLDKPRIRFTLDLIKLGKPLECLGFYCAPFSLAVGLCTYPGLIKFIKRDPAFAHAIFDKLTDEIQPSYLKVMKDYTGVEAAVGADAWAAFPNISPEMSAEWAVGYSLRLFQNCLKFGMAAAGLAMGDYCEERLEKFDKDILFRCFDTQVKSFFGLPIVFLGMGRWQDYPLEPVAEYMDKYKQQGIRGGILAGINARMLRDGPPERIVDNVKRYVKVLGKDHNLSILLANIPADTPPDHVHAAVAAVCQYGHLPITQDVDSVKFEMPHRESFAEFVDRMSGGAGLLV